MKLTNRCKLAIGAALLAAASLTALAQSDTTPAPGEPHNQMRHGFGPGREVQHLTHMLSLTADQQKGVTTILQQQEQQIRALQNNQTANAETTVEARRTQIEQIRDESNTKISALLDDTQKTKFNQWIEERKAAMARRQGQAAGQTQAQPQP
jgi:periplasmic protein CpxP/Spy